MVKAGGASLHPVHRRQLMLRCAWLRAVKIVVCLLWLLTMAGAQQRAAPAPPGQRPPITHAAQPPAAQPPAPTIASVQPPSLAQGSPQVRMTITGANFRPGAQVQLGGPQGNPNVSVTGVTVRSANVILATVSVGPQAPVAPLSVDVQNGDGTSTRTNGNTRSVFVVASTSLAAPLSVQRIVVTSPRDGALISQGDDYRAAAILSGTGTGVISGEWLWDGMVAEQFTASMAGGQRVTVRTMSSLPTLQTGQHTLAVRITNPGTLQTKPILLVVSAGKWQELTLLAPRAATRFLSDAPPKLVWSIVPGVNQYQVGFSAKPFFTTIAKWYDVSEPNWQVDKDVWAKLPLGAVYWTVRAVDASGTPRKPAPMRRLLRTMKDALTADSRPGAATVLRWKPLEDASVYRVTVATDGNFTNVLRRYMTPNASVDLQVIRGKLEPGKTYYWRVEALSKEGRVLMTGPRQSYKGPPAA